MLDDKSYSRFTSPSGKVWLTASYNIHYPFQVSAVARISGHKNLAYSLAEQTGLTVPKTWLVTTDPADQPDYKAMLQFAPLIVKPTAASLSRGLTLNIETIEQIKAAVAYACTYYKTALVQQQVSGEEIRFMVINQKVKAAILRQTAQVIGDGVRTVAELIQLENDERQTLVLPYISYPQLTAELIDSAFFDDITIPTAGKIVKLGQGTMIRSGASMYNVLENVHPSYVAAVEKMAATIGDGFFVADVFVDDFEQSMSPTNHAFIEINTAPVLLLFYSCRDLRQYDVLSELVPNIDRALHA